MCNKHCKQPCCYKHEVLLKMRTTLCSHDEQKYLKISNNYIEGPKEFWNSKMELQNVQPHVLAQSNKV